MAVVKANAYGHGIVTVAQALADADAFAVARVEEAIELREASVARRIVLLQGVIDAGQLRQAVQADLDLVVHHFAQVELLEQCAFAHRFVIWLKINSGMNRLGLRPAEAQVAWRRLTQLPVPPQELHLMTHLACADEPNSTLTAQQLTQFHAVRTDLETLSSRRLTTSIGNSAGTLTGIELQGDWVRPGIALYGVSPFAARTSAELGLLPVMTLESAVIALRELAAGESVGYGASWRAARASRIAIVAGGYADGVPRALPNAAPVLINGRRAGLAGRVSMDMLAVDVTEVPGVDVGTPVILWGEGLPVEELAAAAATIPYELLSGVGSRVALEPC